VKIRLWNLQSGRFLLSLALIASALIPGCGDEKVESRWVDGEIVLDGIPDEWQGPRTYIDSPNIALAAMNDETHLYIALVTPVRSIAARILGQGLIVWFEPGDRGDRKFGIRCPMGMEDFKPMRGAGDDPARIRELLRDAETRLEILGPSDDDTAILLNDGARGVQVALGYRDGNFGYELKVPLAITGDRDFGIGGDVSKPVRVGFETPEANLEAMREAMPARKPQGGDIGDGRGDMHRGGIDGEMMRGAMPGGTLEAIKVWTSITLATADAGSE
jgi:hypothetical protein